MQMINNKIPLKLNSEPKANWLNRIKLTPPEKPKKEMNPNKTQVLGDCIKVLLWGKASIRGIKNIHKEKLSEINKILKNGKSLNK